jgi:glyoxylase I family protein
MVISRQETKVANAATMPAITHVAVTVTDLAASEAWYTKVLGVKPVLDEDTGPFRHIVYLLGNTALGLHGFPDLASTEPFNERTPGLDHLAFGVTSRDELAEWAARLDELGVAHSEHRGRLLRLRPLVPRP